MTFTPISREDFLEWSEGKILFHRRWKDKTLRMHDFKKCPALDDSVVGLDQDGLQVITTWIGEWEVLRAPTEESDLTEKPGFKGPWDVRIRENHIKSEFIMSVYNSDTDSEVIIAEHRHKPQRFLWKWLETVAHITRDRLNAGETLD